MMALADVLTRLAVSTCAAAAWPGPGGRPGAHPGRHPCLIWYPGPPRARLCL